MRFVVALLVSCAVLTGCQTSTGVMRYGPNEYVISVKSAPLRGGSTASRQVAIAEATKTCEQQGRQAQVISEDAGPVTVDLRFRCVAPTTGAQG